MVVRNSSNKRGHRPGLAIVGKLSPSAVICFCSWKGQWLVCKSSLGFVISLAVTHKSISLLLGVWQHRIRLTMQLMRAFPMQLSLSEDVFSNMQNARVVGPDV